MHDTANGSALTRSNFVRKMRVVTTLTRWPTDASATLCGYESEVRRASPKFEVRGVFPSRPEWLGQRFVKSE